MDPRFRGRPSNLLLDDLAPQAFFELGELRSLSQDVPLEDVPSQNIAILPPEEAADDGACWYACDEEEEAPHGSARRTAAPAAAAGVLCSTPRVGLPGRASDGATNTQRSGMINFASETAGSAPRVRLGFASQKSCVFLVSYTAS